MRLSRLDQLLSAALDQGASDLHLIIGVPPAFRVNGEIILGDQPPLDMEAVAGMAFSLLNSEQREQFEREWELCISLPHGIAGRVRVTLYRRNGNPELSIRFCGKNIISRDELGLPAKIDELAMRPNGLVLITGPTGAGKDPDVIVVGEMRDHATISAALTSAETGHLVLATLHSPNVVHAFERIVGVFEGSAQRQIIVQLANSLQGIIAQDLLPSADRMRRVLAYELLIANSAVRNLIRENNKHLLENIIQTGGRDGMVLMDACLYDLYCRCLISYDTALSRARNPDRMAKRTG